MRKLLLFSMTMLAACSTPKSRSPAAVKAPAGSLELRQALKQESETTLTFLKGGTTAKAYPVTSRDPAGSLPESLKAVRSKSASTDKRQQQHFLRRFHHWSLARKSRRAEQLIQTFTCENVIETQALGFSLELDFPQEEAKSSSRALHEKVLTCENFPRQESFFRLALSSIQGNDCPKALAYLEKFPKDLERGVSDRLSYIKSFCSDSKEVSQRNPLGGYGVLLTDAEKSEEAETLWLLSATSGQEDWDRLLVTFIELQEKGQTHTIQYIASKLDFEKFRSLPRSFQASVLVLMNFAGADLSVFQILHRYLADHPEHISPSVVGLLFPTRFWDEIQESSQAADPLLVKSLIRQESAFNPAARSHAKAMGLMQLIFPTAKHFGITRRQQLFTPEDNIRAGSEFLARLIEEFGSVELALAAYNAGPGMVRQWKKRYPTDNRDLFVEMIPYSETREYVRLVNRNYKVYQSFLTKSPLPTQLAVRSPASTAAELDSDFVSSPVVQSGGNECFQRMIIP